MLRNVSLLYYSRAVGPSKHINVINRLNLYKIITFIISNSNYEYPFG